MLLASATQLLLTRSLRRGVQNVRRDRRLGSTLGALLGTALLIQILCILFLGVLALQHLLRSQTDLRLEVLRPASMQTVQQFLATLRDLPYVADVAYVTSEQAYERERMRDPELISFLDEYGLENPFPDTVAVTLKSLNDYDAFSRFVRQEEWRGVIDPAFLSQVTDQEEQVYAMLRFTEAGRSLTFLFLILLIGVTLFILIELVSRRALARSEELLVERLVGAPVLASILPFAVEGAILLLSAVLLSAFVMALMLFLLPLLIPALEPNGIFAGLRETLMPLLRSVYPFLLFLELLLAPLLALGGAWVGLRAHMKVSSLSFS